MTLEKCQKIFFYSLNFFLGLSCRMSQHMQASVLKCRQNPEKCRQIPFSVGKCHFSCRQMYFGVGEYLKK